MRTDEAKMMTKEIDSILHPYCWRCETKAPSSGGCQETNCGIRSQEPYGYVWSDKNMEQRFSRRFPKRGVVGDITPVYKADADKGRAIVDPLGAPGKEIAPPPPRDTPEDELLRRLYGALIATGWTPPDHPQMPTPPEGYRYELVRLSTPDEPTPQGA